MDTDTEFVWDLFRHLFPEFSQNHVVVYKLLWRIEPLSGERVIEKTGLARATVYRILRELVETGLVKKTNFKPVCYFADNPVQEYSSRSQRTITKLKGGKDSIKRLIDNSSSLSGEFYLVKGDGGQKKLINKKTRQTLLDEFELREIMKTVDKQLKQAEESKLKAWAIYR